MIGVLIAFGLGLLFGYWLVIIHPLNNQQKAIDKSIEKWNGIVYHGKSDNGNNDCECCVQYAGRMNKDECGCVGCPIREIAGDSNCQNTPYTEWVHFVAYRDNKCVFDNTSLRLAVSELAFLKNVSKTIYAKRWWAISPQQSELSENNG